MSVERYLHRVWLIGAIIASVCLPHRAFADARVITKAMEASTIAEIFVEKKSIRVEIEVGAEDLPAFKHILPDNFYEELTGRNEPLAQRQSVFLESDWVLQADGHLLPGQVEGVMPTRRLVRDDVTGQPLIKQPLDAELVIRLTLRYELTEPPQTLTITPPRDDQALTATIGFVCYHQEIPVNDFRYLSQTVTLDLDWEDPWYSRFRHPNLKRQYDAPLSAFLYVEPYEVRQEIIIRPRDIENWLDLQLPDDGVILVDQQEALKRSVSEFLAQKNPVTVNGHLVQGRLDRIHFVRRTLRTTGVIEPPIDLDTTSATLGVIFVYPIDQLPKEVSMHWELFSPKIQAIPAATSDEAGALPAEITVADPVLVWKNHLSKPTAPALMNVAIPPSRRQWLVPLLSVLCVGVVLGIACWYSFKGTGYSRSALVATLAFLVVSVFSLPFATVTIADPFTGSPNLSADGAKEVVSSLLYNVYRSFDHHDDHLVYDRLAKSISGDLLSDVYLETRKSMEVKNQGGLRISVKDVAVTELEPVNHDAEEPTYRCRWRVSGWIGHWGHVHRRENEHLAYITLGVRDGVWKITSMELLDEQSIGKRLTETST